MEETVSENMSRVKTSQPRKTSVKKYPMGGAREWKNMVSKLTRAAPKK